MSVQWIGQSADLRFSGTFAPLLETSKGAYVCYWKNSITPNPEMIRQC